jgi:SAM-dependent methyltransferase
VAGHWSDDACGQQRGGAPIVHWTGQKLVAEIVGERIAGDPSFNWVRWVREAHIPVPLEKGISVGCGTGPLERHLIDGGICLEVVGVDVAPGAVEIARREAAGRPLSYFVVDLETEPLPGGPYDVVFFNSVLHHVNRLDFCIDQAYSSLAEGGLLVACEFVGPSRFQWLPEQLRLASDMYGFLPPAYRLNHQVPGTVGALRRADICEMIEGDPSEAVRSSEMMAVLTRYFERLDAREMGGTLLNPLLGGIAGNFDDSSELDSSFIRLAALLEEALIENGELGSDFVVEVFRKRLRPGGGASAREADRQRSAKVEQQENEIVRARGELERLGRLESDARTRTGKLASRAVALGAGIEAQRLANARLKTGLFFKAAHSVSVLLGPGQAPRAVEDTLEARAPQGPACPIAVSGSLPAPVSAVFPRSALAAAVESVAADPGSCNRTLWLEWLGRATGQEVGRTLMLGLEASHAELACEAGVCSAADVARLRVPGQETGPGLAWSVLDPPPPRTAYELVIWDGSMSEVAAMVAPEGGLAVIVPESSVPDGEPGLGRRISECLPRDWPLRHPEGRAGASAGPGAPDLPDEPPPGFRLQAEAAFPIWPGGETQGPLPPDVNEGMARAVASLALYVECCLALRGLLSPRLRVRLYRRVPGTARPVPPAGRATPVDIVAMQELELGRLGRLIERQRLGLAALEDARAAAGANLDSARRTLAYLEEEHALLSAPALIRQARWLAHRLRRGGGSER